MGFFRRLEEKMWLGEVVRDYGVISETRQGITRTRLSVLLCKRDGKPYLVIKESGFVVVAASVRYTHVPLDALGTFRDAVNNAYNQALGSAVTKPPAECIRREARYVGPHRGFET